MHTVYDCVHSSSVLYGYIFALNRGSSEQLTRRTHRDETRGLRHGVLRECLDMRGLELDKLECLYGVTVNCTDYVGASG